jgi:glutaredoxin-like YruB-family protein
MDVKIYSTPSCGYCKMAKQYFQDNDIAYEEYNVAEDAAKREEMVQMTGQMGVPVIQVKDKVLIGFDQSALEEMLQG